MYKQHKKASLKARRDANRLKRENQSSAHTQADELNVAKCLLFRRAFGHACFVQWAAVVVEHRISRISKYVIGSVNILCLRHCLGSLSVIQMGFVKVSTHTTWKFDIWPWLFLLLLLFLLIFFNYVLCSKYFNQFFFLIVNCNATALYVHLAHFKTSINFCWFFLTSFKLYYIAQNCSSLKLEDLKCYTPKIKQCFSDK